MATPKFDRIAINFLSRVPDAFQSAFTPGTSMPEPNILTKAQVINYVNRALNQLFNDFWTAVGGDVKAFIKIFPELTKYSADAITFSSGNYTIANPNLDLYKVIGAVIDTTNIYIKPKDEHKYTLYLSQEYEEYKATDANPVIIQVNRLLALFPQSTKSVRLHYIAAPIDPTTGAQLTQNGTYDSPYFDHWNDMITDIAYNLFLKETTETT